MVGTVFFLLGFLLPSLTTGSSICSIKHVHLAVGKNASTSMTISFAAIPNNRNNGWPDQVIPKAVIDIGRRPHHLKRNIIGKRPPNNYQHTDCMRNQSYTSPYYYHVNIDDLEPDTEYYYQASVAYVLDENQHSQTASSNSQSEDIRLRRRLQEQQGTYLCSTRPPVRKFRTAPSPNTNSPVTLALLGDLGRTGAAVDTIQHLYDDRHNYSTVVLLGDIAYTDNKHHFQFQWDEWFDLFDKYPTMESTPLQVIPGNHDIELMPNKGGQVFLAYESRFLMPQVKPAETTMYPNVTEFNMANVPYPIGHDYGNSFYSFTYGPAYIIVLNSYASVDPGSKQYEWLVKELEGVDRTVTPWLLCMIHCPLYNTFHHHYRDIQLVKGREYLEPLFYSYRVNGVFSGHVHAYQRTRNVYKDKVDRLGPMHVIVGEGGKTINTEARSVQPEEWIAVRDETAYGYGQLILHNKTTAEWRWIHTKVGEQNYNWFLDSNKTEPAVETDVIFLENQLYLSE